MSNSTGFLARWRTLVFAAGLAGLAASQAYAQADKQPVSGGTLIVGLGADAPTVNRLCRRAFPIS